MHACHNNHCKQYIYCCNDASFSALMLLVALKEGYLACKKSCSSSSQKFTFSASSGVTLEFGKAGQLNEKSSFLNGHQKGQQPCINLVVSILKGTVGAWGNLLWVQMIGWTESDCSTAAAAAAEIMMMQIDMMMKWCWWQWQWCLWWR